MEWTKEQEKVIYTRNKNILVSAAAGSGKTAVLVERIINRILDKENPVGIDRLLVVTFTKAAAAEMRERIMKAIVKAADNDPENEYLRKQLNFIHNAKITTIDSFCKSIVKDNFNKIEVDPSFRIAGEDELALIKQDVMTEVFEKYFASGDKDFLDFADTRGGRYFEENISEIVFRLYRYSQSNPFPEKWLDECLTAYDTAKPMEKNIWLKRMDKLVRNTLLEVEETYKDAIEICYEAMGPVKYAELFTREKETVSALIKTENYYELCKKIKNIQFDRLPTITKKDENVDVTLKTIAKGKRDLCKSKLSELLVYCYENEADFKNELSINYNVVSLIVKLVKDFTNSFNNYKREHNMVDFNDLEHMALKILTDVDESGNVCPSKVALELSSDFDEIMIDEYQDSNMVQEYLLSAVSNGNNMFMVGDVKQSIYKFRMAKPELFLSKYDSFPTDDAGNDIRITLSKNFRSRNEIIESVNDVFLQIMGKDLGGIDYDDDHKLYLGAAYNEINPEDMQKSQIILIDKGENPDEKIKIEASVIARQIKKMMYEGFKVTDKATGEARKLRYSDIAILVRSGTNGGDEISDELIENGIPSHVEKNTGYFDTLEISSILNMLSIIDNPHQDIPLAAVLKNIYLFTPTEMSYIAAGRSGDLYDGIVEYIDKNKDSIELEQKEISIRLCGFISFINNMRKKSKYTSICNIINDILDETGYKYYVAAMTAGDRRMANISMLLKKAEDYEKTSYVGLFNFVRYIENIKKYQVDVGEAASVGESDDSVKVMTIHKSKGLEFPVVFLACAGKKFNERNAAASIVVHEKYGIGLDYIDVLKRTKKNTCVRKFISNRIKVDDMAEELRVLYVALTRAKEKLIVLGTTDNEKLAEKLNELEEMTEKKFSSEYLTKCKSYLEWIMSAYARKKDSYEFSLMEEEKLVEMRVIENIYADVFFNTFSRENISKCVEELDDKESNPCRLFNAVYKYEADTKLNSKYSVSEIKKMIYENGVDEEDEEQISLYEATHTRESYVPSFMKKEKEELKGSDRGTAYHRVFELIDYEKDISGEASVQLQIDDMVKEGYISEAMAEVIEPSKIFAFLESKIGKRMKVAADKNCLFREQQYVMGVNASDIHADYDGDEMVLVQGAIDAYIVEDGLVTIIDYKTDNVREPEQLVTLYKGQLDYYGKAIENVTGMKVKEKIIYSVKFNTEINV